MTLHRRLIGMAPFPTDFVLPLFKRPKKEYTVQ